MSKVYLVGAGPGDPDLLTVKALRALQDADIVFYDELVSPEILDRIRRDAARVPIGRRDGEPAVGQDAVNKLTIDAARSGQRAVRLKGCDIASVPGGEELETLRKAGVACLVVPGVAAKATVDLPFSSSAMRPHAPRPRVAKISTSIE